MADYKASSPYFSTPVNKNFLDVMVYRNIPKEADDIPYTIKPQHAYRPDILAYDLYGDASLWWVFAMRNPNTIEDPIYDFTVDTVVYLPKLATLKRVLGI